MIKHIAGPGPHQSNERQLKSEEEPIKDRANITQKRWKE
jgi:hypothetical protein